MNVFEAFFLGILQSATEFIPISSSGHLLLAEHFLGLSLPVDVLQHFDIVLHAGTLIGIVTYFHKAWWQMLRKPFTGQIGGGPPLLPLLIIATLPVIGVGAGTVHLIEHYLRYPMTVYIGFLSTGALLMAAAFIAVRRKEAGTMLTMKRALCMGLGQVVSLLPGFSRSGWTIGSGMMSGLSAVRATEISFLMGAPALFAAVTYTAFGGLDALQQVGMTNVAVGFFTSLVTSVLVIHAFLQLTKRFGVWVWSVYLFIAGMIFLTIEFRPYLEHVQDTIADLPLPLVLGILFVALLLESIPVTSTIAPGTIVMFAAGGALAEDPIALTLGFLVGTTGLVCGHAIGYFPARRAGHHLRKKKEMDERIGHAQKFFRRWGTLAVIVGGWYAASRTVISVVAGISQMSIRRFLIATIIGSALWVGSVFLGAALFFEQLLL